MNRIVNKIVSKYHSRNPIDIAQGMNIKVAYADLGENVHGFYQYYKRGMVIYINSSLDEFMQLQVLRHEIGHAVLHRKTNLYLWSVQLFKFPINMRMRLTCLQLSSLFLMMMCANI